MHYDVFNGDADGIIALLQLRLAFPKSTTLITGVKRDIQLLQSLTITADDSLTVLDISMNRNREALDKALGVGAAVFYADHHKADDIPQHDKLDAHIDLDANTCTALIIDQLLNSRFHYWAIAAAYGDNLIAKADKLALEAGLTREQSEQLKQLGTLINYNGYGSQLEDLHFHPAELFKKLLAYDDPFAVIADQASPFNHLKLAYQADMNSALSTEPTHQTEQFALYQLIDSAASRRISGVLGNELANQTPSRAHAVLTENRDGTFMVSLRAPLENKQGAGDICAQFETGGGRAAAGGINRLPAQQVDALIQKVEAYYR
ncbi:DHH family phosphoesterase [Vibrio sp. LaRot3]|uniref:DHH family phosphoesterase n=1 Tax=Vibrio sp. LaRot3 TaxID=2998829 RepID=UPI0022CE14C1|nr:DHH family phosphoesterase [Vibrio sp. LaRot3]MDA0150534.1 DHH family phosphoesterase [Vibrio sp. LaRot3]